jgi:NitT/TauT family transport system substrate-binding protein
VTEIRILFSRYSAFYSPLIATRAAGFLADEGLDATFSVASPGEVPRARLGDGSVHLIQSAVGASFAPLERGETSEIVHFAQINQRDGFLITARTPDPAFRWDKLAGARVLVDHGAQPLAMFKFALHCQGVAYGDVIAVDAGTSAQMADAFRAGEADYVHLQGPAPQQLEKDGVGHIVASVGEAFGPVAFSSLCSTRSWLAGDMAQAFMRAYRKAQAWVLETPAREIAKVEGPYFEGIDADVLERTIAFYQQLGNWAKTPEIPRDAYEVTLDVFAHSGLITRRHAYEAVVVPPPGS